jgi:hypothetical protein
MKPMATVSPENRTARPAVAIVRARASGTGWRPTSSRNGQPGRDHGAEDEEEQQERQGQRDHLGALQVLLGGALEVFVQRHLARRDHLQGAGAYLLPDGRVGVLQLRKAALLELDHREGPMSVPGDHRFVGGAALVSGSDLGHPIVVFERLQRALHFFAEGGVRGLHRFAAEDEREARRILRQLLVQQLVDPPGFGALRGRELAGAEPTTVAHQEDGRGQREDRRDEDQPAETVNHASPSREHLISFSSHRYPESLNRRHPHER